MADDFDYIGMLSQESSAPSSSQGNDDFDYVKMLSDNKDSDIKSAVYESKGTDPVSYSKSVVMANKTGLPVDVVHRNPVQAKNLAELNDQVYYDILGKAPRTAQYFSMPDNVKMAKDDVKNLAGFEHIINGKKWTKEAEEKEFKNLTTPIEATTGLDWVVSALPEIFKGPQGMGVVRGGQLGLKQMMQGLTPEEQQELDNINNAPETDYGANNFFKKMLKGTATLLPTTIETAKQALTYGLPAASMTFAASGYVPIIGQVGPLTGGIIAGKYGAAKASFEMEAGNAWIEYSKITDVNGQPMDKDVAKGAALVVGSVNAGLELANIHVLASTIPYGKELLSAFKREGMKKLLTNKSFQDALLKFGKAYGTEFASETLTEVIQEAMNIIGGEVSKKVSPGQFDPMGFSDISSRLTDTAVQTMYGMGLMALPGPGATLTYNLNQVKKAQINKETMRQLGENVTESQHKTRLPEEHKKFVESVKGRGSVENIYINKEKFEGYWQEQGLDPQAIAKELGIEDQMDQVNAGGDIIIPLEVYTDKIAATEHHGGLLNDARMHRGDWSVNEAKEYEKNQKESMKEALDAIKKEQEADVKVESATTKIYDDIYNQMIAAGEKPKAAEANAIQSTAMFASAAKREGIDPFELYQQVAAVQVNKAKEAGEGAMTQRGKNKDAWERGDSAMGMWGYGTQKINMVGGMRAQGGIQHPEAMKLRFHIGDDKGTGIGIVDLSMDMTVNVPSREAPINGLVNIEINKAMRGKGYGSKVIQGLRSLEPDKPFRIYDVKKSALAWWKRRGAVVDKIKGRSNKIDMLFPPLNSELNQGAIDANDPMIAEARKYKDKEDFVDAGYAKQKRERSRIGSAIAKKLGGQYTAKAEVPDNIAGYIGDYGSKISVDGKDIYFIAKSESGVIYLPNIATSEFGTGLGTKFMEALREFADETSQDINVYKVTNPKFFDKFSWFGKKWDGDVYEYKTNNKNFGVSYLRDIWDKAQELNQGPIDVNSEAFKAWFGDSKVVDENGNPEPVYHGSESNIDEFKPEFTGKGNDQLGSGFYFSTAPEEANMYAGNKQGANVLKAYASIQNPIVLKGPNLREVEVSTEQAYNIIKQAPNIMDKENSPLGDYVESYWQEGPKDSMIKKLAKDNNWDLMSLENDFFRGNPTAFRQAVYNATGYDGVVKEYKKSKQVVAWFPSQIKSVNNQGAFDINNPNILKQETYSPDDVKDAMRDIQAKKTSPENVAFWEDIYSKAKKIEKADIIGDIGGKLEGVGVVHLTRNCQRVKFLKQMKKADVIPQDFPEEACYKGACYKDRNPQYGKRASKQGIDAVKKNSVSEKPISFANPETIKKVLTPEMVENLNSKKFIRLGQAGDDSHAIYNGLALEWLKLSKEAGVNVKSVFVTSAYAPTTQEMYDALTPYKDQFVIHVTESGYFSEGEILNRFNEFRKAQKAGLNVMMRVITNKDQITYADSVELGEELGPMDTPQEDFLFKLIEDNELEDYVLETPYHNDFLIKAGDIKRSEATNKFKNICCETDKCKTCGPSCGIFGCPSSKSNGMYYQSEPVFYSPLERRISEKMSNKATPDQIRGLIKDLPKEEIEWMDLETFLTTKDKFTKDEVLEFIKENGVKLDADYGNVRTEIPSFLIDEDGYIRIEIREAYTLALFPGRTYEQLTTPEQDQVDNRVREDNTRKVDIDRDPKWESYTLPGGENYREILMTLPVAPALKQAESDRRSFLYSKDEPLTTAESEELTELTKKYQMFKKDAYFTDHFDVPNIISHIRVDDRQDADGNSVLFINEIQSDWHQDARKARRRELDRRIEDGMTKEEAEASLTPVYGYKLSPLEEKKLDEEYEKAWDKVREFTDKLPPHLKNHEFTRQIGYISNVFEPNFSQAAKDAVEKARSIEARRNESNGYDRVPNAPFKKTWMELAIKRMLREAVEKGYDKLAWASDPKDIAIIEHWEDGRMTKDEEGIWLDDNNVTKIIERYTKDIPRYLNKIGKKWGASVETTEIMSPQSFKEGTRVKDYNQARDILENGGELWFELDEGGYTTLEDIDEFDSMFEDREDFIENAALYLGDAQEVPRQVLSITITDEMRRSVMQGQPMFQNNKKVRGAILPKRISGGDKNVITLFKERDFSTMLHETGHLYLEIYNVLANRPTASESIKKDFAALLNWLEVDSFDKITTAQHEKFARGIEKYFMTGEAPSLELKPVFRQFKEWLTKIYKKAVNLNVDITPEIKEVFDRMFATDEQIATAKATNNFYPIFNSAKEAEMSDAEFADYNKLVGDAQTEAEEELLNKTMEKVRKRRELQYKVERNKVKQEVMQKVISSPTYQAIEFLRTGEFTEGETPENIKGLKLDRKYMIDTYGEKPVMNSMMKYGGVHPDVIAEIFGFSSGDQMIKIIQSAEEKSAAIEKETDRVMDERNPDILNEESIAEEAASASNNTKRTDLLMTEFRVLTNRALIAPTPIEQIRAKAKAEIQATRISNLQPSAYLRYSVTASNEVARAIKAGNMKNAAFYKFRQIYNLQLFREARNAKAEADKTIAYMAKFEDNKVRKQFGKAGEDYLDQIDSILERFDFKKNLTMKAIERREALIRWVDAKTAEGEEVVIDDKILNEAYRKSYKTMSVAELNQVKDAVKNLEHLVRLKNKLLSNLEQRTFDNVKSEIIASLVANNDMKEAPNKKYIEFGDKTKKLMSGAHAWLSKMEFYFKALDGEKALGPVWRYLFKPIADAEAAEQVMMAKASKDIKDIFSEYTKKERQEFHKGKIYIDKVGESYNKASILMVALNWGNADNRQAIMDGFGYSQEQVEAILDKLDKRDWDTVQKIWDFLDSFWPEIAELQRQMTGLAPAKVEALPVSNKHGEYRGGYFPLSANPDHSFKAMMNQERDSAKELFASNFMKPQTKKGHTIERKGFGVQPVRLDMSVISEHVSNVIHDLTHRKAIVDVDKIIRDPEVRKALVDASNMDLYKQIRPWLQSIASEKRDPTNYIERIINHARTGASVVAMGWKITTAIVQPLGFLQSIAEIGVKNTMYGMKEFYGNPRQTIKRIDFIMERSEQMKNRMKTFDRDVRDSLKTMTHGEDINLTKFFFYLTGMADMSVSMPTWLGAYNKGLSEGLLEQAAVDYADSVVRTSQGAGGVKDQAMIQRGNPIQKTFTMFYSYFSVLYNLMSRENKALIDNGVGGFPRWAASMVILWFLPALLSELVAQRGPDDDEGWLTWALENLMAYPINTIPLVRDMYNGMFGDYGYNISPVVAAFESTVKFKDQIAQGEMDKALYKAGLEATGYWLHLPSRQLYITSEAVYELLVNGGDVGFKDLFFPRKD